uniref:DRBM domain-containing protein n=1 Tax=Ditylenchus dipsaci TaxID=166011 RepID=A0A915DGB3_9BILA
MVQLPVPAPSSLNLPVKLPSPPQPISMLQLHTHPIKNAGIPPTHLPPPALPAQKPQSLSAMPSPAPYKWPFVSPTTQSLLQWQTNMLNNQRNRVQNVNSSRPANYLMSMPPPPLLNGAYKQFCQPLFGGMNGLRSTVLMPKMQHQTVYKAVVRLSDGSEHVTTGLNKQMAKSSAATKALFHLRPLLESLMLNWLLPKKAKETGKLLQEINSLMSTNSTDSFDDGISSETSNTNSSDSSDADNSEQVDQAVSNEHKNDNSAELKNEVVFKKKKKTKSIISQIHERALRLKMNVEFEIVVEKGTSQPEIHLVLQNDFTYQRKKQAKQDACRKIFEKIKGIENDPLRLASLIVKNEKKQHFPSVPKENKRKTIIKDKKMDPECAISQSQCLIARRTGASRYKIFVIEVTCLNFREEGTGPNKKLAKRAAAEAMLNQIGYVKSMPQPGKSLLKRKEGQDEVSYTVDIGVFDPSEFMCMDSKDNKEDSKSSVAVPNTAMTFADLSMETFADVENFNKQETLPIYENNNCSKPKFEQNGWGDPCDDFKADPEGDKSPNGSDFNEDSPTQESPGPIKSSGRRVTFSNEVSACPPPDDLNYPAASITPLKSEVVLVNKLKKMECAENAASIGLNSLNGETDPINLIKSIQSAKHFLDVMSKSHKFTVVYSDFPKNSADEQCFSLVTLGLEKPIVSPGTGVSEEHAHNDAACNAIKSLAQIDAN